MSTTVTLYPSSLPRFGDSAFDTTSRLQSGRTSADTYYYAILPFAAIDPSWRIISLKLIMRREDTYSTFTQRFGSNESGAWANRNALDWNANFSVSSGTNTKTWDLTAYADTINGYAGTWYLHLAHGSGSVSFCRWTQGTSGDAPRLEVEYEIASIEPDPALECGVESTLTVETPMGGAASYDVKYSIGASSGTIGSVDGGATDTLTWTPPLALADEITAAVSGTITLALYDGVNLAYSVDLPLAIPASMVPSISDTDFEVVNAAGDEIGIHVQGHSATKATVSAASVYGATIADYALTIGGKTYHLATSAVTSDALTVAGILNATVTVTDTRGRTATQSITGAITVYAYAEPIITDLALARCTSDGTESNDGTYIKASIACKTAALNDLNTLALSVKFRASGGSYGSAIAVDLPTTGDVYNFTATAIIGAGGIGAGAYDVQATLSDHYDSIVEVETLASATRWLTLKADGTIKFHGNLVPDASVLAALVETLAGGGMRRGKLVYDVTLAESVAAGSDVFAYTVPSGAGAEGALYEFELWWKNNTTSGNDARMWVNDDTTQSRYMSAMNAGGTDYTSYPIVGYSGSSAYKPGYTRGTISVMAGVVTIVGSGRRALSNQVVMSFAHIYDYNAPVTLTKIAVRGAQTVAAGARMKIWRLA